MNESNDKPVVRGSEEEITAMLSERFFAGVDVADIVWAVGQIEGGEPFVELDGTRFEVVDPEWSVVQDVYGCELARDCPDHTNQQRRDFELMIQARMQAEG